MSCLQVTGEIKGELRKEFIVSVVVCIIGKVIEYRQKFTVHSIQCKHYIIYSVQGIEHTTYNIYGTVYNTVYSVL